MKALTKIVPILVVAGLALTACGSSVDAEVDASSATIEAPRTITEGELTFCTPFESPPNNFYDENHVETGAEVDLARMLAAKMGLAPAFRETKFAAIIPTLQAQQCDVIMASLYIKPEREEIVDFVPYMLSGQAVAVRVGNPNQITGMDDSLCGMKIGVKVGTTAALKSEEQAADCSNKGLDELTLMSLDNQTIGLQQVTAGQLDAYSDTSALVLYYQTKEPDAFEIAGEPYGKITIGAAVNKGSTELQNALSTALDEVRQEGTYDAILADWNIGSLALD